MIFNALLLNLLYDEDPSRFVYRYYTELEKSMPTMMKEGSESEEILDLIKWLNLLVSMKLFKNILGNISDIL